MKLMPEPPGFAFKILRDPKKGEGIDNGYLNFIIDNLTK
jgi:hypothetical protein